MRKGWPHTGGDWYCEGEVKISKENVMKVWARAGVDDFILFSFWKKRGAFPPIEYERGDCDCGGEESVNALEYVKIPT